MQRALKTMQGKLKLKLSLRYTFYIFAVQPVDMRRRTIVWYVRHHEMLALCDWPPRQNLLSARWFAQQTQLLAEAQ
jgi:hypothetical protein